jgi:hypothetical protein
MKFEYCVETFASEDMSYGKLKITVRTELFVSKYRALIDSAVLKTMRPADGSV